MIWFFGVASFVASALLFAVQPMVAKMLLPRLGGVPAVWTTCMLFFQTMLLAGYASAHGFARLRPLAQLASLGSLWLLAASALPIRLADGVPPSALAAGWVLESLASALLFPVLALTLSAPLLQSWFTRVTSRSPYPLYAASNAGSLLALLAYPLWLEPRWPLHAQAELWQAAFLGAAAITCCCGLAVALVGRRDAGLTIEVRGPAAPDLRHVSRWLVTAFVPASLLLGATTYAATDLAAVPLLWVLPLALYLATYIAAFARPPVAPSQRLNGVFLLLSALLVFLFIPQSSASAPWVLVHFVYLTLGSLIFHRALVALRPDAQHLTQFYLAIAAGGALAGIFHSLLAPLLFARVLEYPLTMVLACGLLPALPKTSERARQESFVRGLGLSPEQVLTAAPSLWPERLDWLWPVGLGLLSTCGQQLQLGRGAQVALGVGLPILLAGVSSLGRRRRFAWSLLAVLVAAQMEPDVVARRRSFYGALRVEKRGEYQVLFHGTTVHGREPLAPDRRGEPTTYYAKGSPLGALFQRRARAWEHARVAVIGLGVGTLAAYAQPGQTWHFLELDPNVVELARRYFSFLGASPAPTRVSLGDARINLEREPAGQYDVLIADPFTSDAVPVHLLTREALATYVRALAPGGLLLLNATNRHLRVDDVLATLAQDAGMFASVARDRATDDRGRVASTWVLMARKASDAEDLRADPRWQPLQPTRPLRVWTDDYSSLVAALRLAGR